MSFAHTSSCSTKRRKAITNFLDQVPLTSAQQRLYWRLRELQKKLAEAHRSVAEKPEHYVVQIVDELMQVVEDLLEIAPTSPKSKKR
jgi:hypothetical protein